MRLAGKVAAITGGALGFGAAAAELFACEGAGVLVGDVLEEQGHEVAARIRDAGGRAEFALCDVTSEASVKAFTARAEEAFGKLDVLVANAGILIPGKVEDVTEDETGG